MWAAPRHHLRLRPPRYFTPPQPDWFNMRKDLSGATIVDIQKSMRERQAGMDGKIISDWKRVARAKVEVELLNVYKGLPIIYKAGVDAVVNETVQVRVPTYEAICLTLTPKTTVLSNMLEEAVTANVPAVDIRAGTATLDHFRYATKQVGDRMTLRAEPRDPITVRLESGGQTLTGTLADLSVSGAGVLVAQDQAETLRPRAVVRLNLPLPLTTLELAGVVRYLRPAAGVGRVGVAFAPDAHLRTVFDYLNHRRSEILHELRDLYRSAVA